MPQKQGGMPMNNEKPQEEPDDDEELEEIKEEISLLRDEIKAALNEEEPEEKDNEE